MFKFSTQQSFGFYFFETFCRVPKRKLLFDFDSLILVPVFQPVVSNTDGKLDFKVLFSLYHWLLSGREHCSSTGSPVLISWGFFEKYVERHERLVCVNERLSVNFEKETYGATFRTQTNTNKWFAGSKLWAICFSANIIFFNGSMFLRCKDVE